MQVPKQVSLPLILNWSDYGQSKSNSTEGRAVCLRMGQGRPTMEIFEWVDTGADQVYSAGSNTPRQTWPTLITKSSVSTT